MNDDPKNDLPSEEKEEVDTEHNELSYDEAWAEFAGESQEMRYHLEEERKETLKKFGCSFNELPKHVQDQMLREEYGWISMYGGNGMKAQQLHDKYEKDLEPEIDEQPDITESAQNENADNPESSISPNKFRPSWTPKYDQLFNKTSNNISKDQEERDREIDLDFEKE